MSELDLTEDLDEVYRVLNALKTGGGTRTRRPRHQSRH